MPELSKNRSGLYTADGRHITIDGSGSLVTITYEHHKVHEGQFYSVGHYADAVADTGIIEMLFTTPETFSAHMYLKVVAGGDALFSAFEDSTRTAGTSITSVNHDRTSTNTCSCTISHTPGGAGDGTQLWLEYVPGGTGIGAGGGSHTPGAVQGVSSEQVILAEDTTYLFRLQNTAGVAEPLQITMAYYMVSA